MVNNNKLGNRYKHSQHQEGKNVMKGLLYKIMTVDNIGIELCQRWHNKYAELYKMLLTNAFYMNRTFLVDVNEKAIILINLILPYP
ncbi:hypothetical protein BLOT_012389 [Blomia tropicalis]|nr:hypothetical protein BLOT_012389 [Blomia tropicalis]